MTFDLSAEDQMLRERARAFAESLRNRASEFDRAAAIPADVVRAARALHAADTLALVIVVEEIAAVSAAAAISAAAAGDGAAWDLTGLRGAKALEGGSRSQLVLAAAALGMGTAAVAVALSELRRSTTAGADVEKPHWVIADAATEVEAARLLTYKAARTAADADIALARLMASGAAQRAVDAALRVTGEDALKEGSVLERLSRDVRAAALVLGTEDHQRVAAAQGLLPDAR